jgi:tRNA A-37 threonylcarbamoyl transferase component Bud32
MAFVEINPLYRTELESLGLTAPARLAALPGLVVSGHPDRHVARVQLGGRTVFLKREHRIRWRERLRAAAVGFGFVSKSVREARILTGLRQAGVRCPDWIAAGEDGDGHAFLLLEEVTGVDLRQYLLGLREERCRFARRLGVALAEIHRAGFDHPDLYAKHILVDPATGEIAFIDWQRSRRRKTLGWRERARDLAALDATLSGELACLSERMACLCAYLHTSGRLGIGVRQFVSAIRDESRRLLARRHIRKERASPPPVAAQGILWLDGEALCVTQEFWQEIGGIVPDWLPMPSRGSNVSQMVNLSDGRRALLVRRRRENPLPWLWSLLRGRPLLSPELRQAGLLFRRVKHGQDGPRVLAFGQRRPKPWRVESFVLLQMTGPDEEGRQV